MSNQDAANRTTPTDVIARGATKETSSIRAKFTSALLMLMTLAIGVGSIFLLSVTLAQTRLSNIAVDGVHLNIFKISYVGQQWASLQRKHEDVLLNLSRASQDRSDISAQVGIAEESWRQKWAQVGPLLDVIGQRVQSDRPDLAARDADSAADVVARIVAKRSEFLTAYPDLAPLLEYVEKASDGFQSAHALRLSLRAQSRWLLSRISLLVDEEKTTAERRGNVYQLIKPDMDPPTRAKIENAFYEMYGDSTGSEIWTRFVTLQADTLTLWLVLLMGVLGSSLQVTHAFYRTGVTGTVGAYVLRLSVGALAAVIIFIVAKAGVPVIADFSRIGGDAAINPYFVSFLAIISGLLSENAIANIQTQGARLLGGGVDGPKRWARQDLTETLQKQNMAPDALGDHLGVSRASAEAMLKGEASLEPAQQKILALILRADPRMLYTDIPPRSEKSDGK